VQDGAQVTVADDFSGGRLENLKSVLEKIAVERVDLRDYANCGKVCRGQSIVFNLAAKVTGIGYNLTHHREMFEINMQLQQNVIHAAAHEGVKRFVQISTACTYPHDAIVPTPESEGMRGEPEPTNQGYGWAKRMGERLAEYYTRETEMEAIIVRPFNIYGPRDYFDLEMCHVIPALVRRILEGQNPVEIWGSGNQARSFMHAKDTARGIQLLAEKAPPADSINVGHEEMITIKDLFELICGILKLKPKAFFNTEKPEGYPVRAADGTKFRAITGFRPQISLAEGIAEVITEYRKYLYACSR
ncbi:MAG: NAD-dependent epimerase/dehydratase family protein, partial [Candidatus Omnitrophica bacterium]|nr:NAD-dependent epimerase/dehydratase family protein [Candidatus Omnitrophota bacterium]